MAQAYDGGEALGLSNPENGRNVRLRRASFEAERRLTLIGRRGRLSLNANSIIPNPSCIHPGHDLSRAGSSIRIPQDSLVYVRSLEMDQRCSTRVDCWITNHEGMQELDGSLRVPLRSGRGRTLLNESPRR